MAIYKNIKNVYISQTDLNDLGRTENLQNLKLLAFKFAAANDLSDYAMVDGYIDAYEDATGIDAGSSTNEIRDATSNYYHGQQTVTPSTSGGTLSTDGDYSIRTFDTTGGNFVTDTALTADILIIAGAGGGGGSGNANYAGGGGGAGGLLYGTGISMNAGTYTVTVGGGGAGGNPDYNGTNGSNSVITETTWGTATAIGGGGGGRRYAGGLDGGSGGGGGSNTGGGGGPAGSATQGNSNGLTGYGNDGGTGVQTGNNPGGGGGGAGGAGGSPYNNSFGPSRAYSISGSSVNYANGGSGAVYQNGNGAAGASDVGDGGNGGGGNGAGGAGGSGIAIIRWPTSVTSEGNLTLISNTQTATAAPTEIRLQLFEEMVTANTINTDTKGWVSRDGGTTYTQVTLSDEGDWQSGKRVFAGTADVSGQPSGTSIKYKVTTHNQASGRKARIHGACVLWK